MTTSITKQEATVIQAIAQNEYNSANYGRPESAYETSTYIWTLSEGLYEIKEGMKMPKGKSLSGVISSLTKKGLVYSDTDGAKEDQSISLTEKGFNVWETQI